MTKELRSTLLGLAAFIVVTAPAGCALRPEWTRDDTGPAQERRVQILEMIRTGEITETNEYGYLVLPGDLAGASVHGTVRFEKDPLMAFFMTWTGFSPDPYCGYEYMEPPSRPDPDPMGSGNGDAESLGDGWYWICAS